ncbi:MAG: FtsW/RodA/SpoVE family cell cycle protein [bacterium]
MSRNNIRNKTKKPVKPKVLKSGKRSLPKIRKRKVSKKPLLEGILPKKKAKKYVRSTVAKEAIRNKLSFKSQFLKIFAFNKYTKPDIILLITFIVLLLSGVFIVLDTSLVFAKREFNNVFHFVLLQSMWVGISFIIFIISYFIDYRIIKKASIFFFIITVGLLIYALFSQEINGAKSWISLGGFTIQPSEIAKLPFVLFIAGFLAKKKKWLTKKEFIIDDLAPFLFYFFVIVGLILLGKDLGTSIIIVATALIMYFFKSSTKYEYVALIIITIIVFLGGILMIASQGYRNERVSVWWNVLTNDTVINEKDEGYQMKQILLALGTGGVTGVGLGESLQKYNLVETTAATDSVIAIIAEEFGFIGVVVILFMFLIFIFRGLVVTSIVKDKYGQIVAIGIVSWIGTQVFVHIASNVAVTPLTGVTLPFLSYGGSSTIACVAAVGILLNISRSEKKD